MKQQSNLICKLLLLLLMLAGTSSAWAVDYIYNIINNSGNLVMRVKSTKTKAYLPDRARTPFAQNYRYYKTLVEAQNDARYGEEVAEGSYGAHAFADNVAISTMGLTAGTDGKYQIYVRYDYQDNNTKVKDNNNQAVRIDGTRAYNFQISTRMIHYSTDTESYTTPKASNGAQATVIPKASEPIRVTATSNISQVPEADRQLPNYKWLFIGTKAGFLGSLGQPDPYDIKIVNVEQYALDKTKVLTAVNTQALPLTPTTNTYLHFAYSTDGAVATNVYRFFFRMIGTQVQVMAAKNLFIYNGDSNAKADGQWFVMNKEQDEPRYNDFHDETCFPSLHMREHGKHEGGNGGDRAVTLYYVRPTHQYVIVGSDGTQRAKAYAPVDDDNTLKVPASIATVVPVDYTYYASLEDAQNATSALNALPAVSTAPVIYVRYAYEAGDNPLVKLNGSARYTVSINDHYVKYDETGAYNSHVAPGSTQEAENGVEDYIWHTWGNDPYGIYVTNERVGNGQYFTGTSTADTIAMGSSGASAAIQKTDSYTGHTPGRYYLVKSPQYTDSRPSYLFRSVYTGDDNFYTWGYFGTEETTADDWDGKRPRLFKSSLVGDDNDALRMEIYELRSMEDGPVTYHVIDKQGREVISAESKKVFCTIPDEIYSPLVSTYHYYPSTAFTVDNGVYTLTDASQEITSRVTTGLNDIYVTYDVGTEIDININTNKSENILVGKNHTWKNGQFYLLKFLNGESYYQEDGKDGITDGTHSKASPPINEIRKAEYPYANGDGAMNIYNEEFTEGKLSGGASERTRMPWGITGGDPYRVKIVAYQNSHFLDKNNVATTTGYFSYFRTYYNTTLRKVITNNVLDDPVVTNADANEVPTEYMILGKKGKYKLVTSDPITDKNDNTTEHRTLHTFEQYWKSYETIRGSYFGQTDEERTQNTPLKSEQRAELEGRGWHTYNAWAYARQWDARKKETLKDQQGNDSIVWSNKAKRMENEEHWYQTFEVGEEFDLIPVSINPAIVLIDNHGWEVFRRPMTKDAKDLIFIKSYDSKMVKAYHWYKAATKAIGYHKYTVSDPALTEDESEEYTSTSLINYPPNYANHPGDWYVTYEVKDEYKYLYNAEAGKSAPVLIKQNSKWAKATSESAIGAATEDQASIAIDKTDVENVVVTGADKITNDILWYLAPNATIDTEMGYAGEAVTYTADQRCFDPYNVQIRNASNSKYFKTAAADATLENAQHWLATNPYNLGLGESTAAGFSAIGHDNLSVNITNTTFMLIGDAHGNMRFCPRFDHESAVTNLTGGSPQLNSWVYDVDNNNNVIETKTDSVAMQAIELYPLQRYQFHIRDLKKGGAADDVLTSNEFYAVAGTSLIHQLSNLTAPLPVEYIRAYCEYQGAFTNFDSSTNTYSGEVTSYPPGTENGIELTHIYVPYTVVSTAAFFNTEAEAVASNNWMFLLQGTESVATIFGKKLIDYGMEVRYGFRDAAQSEDIGVDMPDLTTAERSFVWNSGKYGGFHFLRRGGTPTVNAATGTMTFPEGQESVLSTVGQRRIASKDSTASVYLLSPLNDFRRIAETYMEGSETSFREGSWLWAFIGTPYKFYAINREDALASAEGSRKRLAVAAKTSGKELLVLTDGYQTGETYNPRQAGAYWFTMSKYAVQTDEEAANTFALQLWDGDNIESNDSCIGKGSSANEFVKAPKNLIKKGTTNQPDIAVMKVSSFRAYPWNWDDKKYQNVTVNIYPGTESSHGALALTKTYTRDDRAFIAGDVLDGTDGHFYLRIEAQEDGSWKPNGIVENTMPYDHHLINIPYELRRRYCKYTVEGGSFTVQQDDSDNPTPQVLNIYYTVDTDKAPLFVSEDELNDFRNYITSGTDANFKGDKKFRDYFYFLDLDWNLKNHLYTTGDKTGTGTGYRFSAADPKQMMWYFVGDPYNVRLFNVYTDIKNSNETRNFVRHRYANGGHSTAFNNSDDMKYDNSTFMENVTQKEFNWEMVDPYVGVTGEYNVVNSNVTYRLSSLEGKPFALRMKDANDVTKEVISDATYYYLSRNGSTIGKSLYFYENNTLYPKLNEQNSFPTYPDNRHTANSDNVTVTPLTPARLLVTVYDPDEPTRKVTDNEVSDYFAVSDRFKGVPDNLQRKYCNYWWVSTNPDLKSENLVDENQYYTVSGTDLHLYVQYRETDDSPFSKEVSGVPVLKRDADASPWYNMNIDQWWAFFNSNLEGKTYAVNGKGANFFNNSQLSFVFKGNKLPNTEEKFRKGLQWALVGDPYNFQLRNSRDRMDSDSPNSERRTSYINQTNINTSGTTWTWLRNASTDNEYFLSESDTRKTVVANTTANNSRRDGNSLLSLPPDYSIEQQELTRNFKVENGNGASSITTGDNYATGSNMWLQTVTDEGADNESFDAIVNVYNKLNELVATTGWTELARNNTEWNGHITTEVQRWGCNYHYWADETMTRYPFRTLNQTDGSGNFLVKDGGTVYVTYDYDESLYSSENEYRWVNLFFNWDDDHKEWRKEHKTNMYEYTAEYWDYDTDLGTFVKRKDNRIEQDYDIWEQHDLYVDTQEGWIESPKTTGTYNKNKAYAYHDGGQYIESEAAKSQKWAMIGDPYKFILYNYNRKAEAGANNSYYLRCNTSLNGGNVIENYNFDSFEGNKENYEGLYWTWKVDGTRYTFAQGNVTDGTTYGPRAGLPESFYQDYVGATASDDSEVKKAGFSVETGYLALCDMKAKSLYDKKNLVGSVYGYPTFTHKNLITTQYTSEADGENAPLKYHTGTKDKFHDYDDGTLSRDYTNDESLVDVKTITLDENDQEQVTYVQRKFTELWRETYNGGSSEDVFSSGKYAGYYVGPEGNNDMGLKRDEYKEFVTYKSEQSYDVASVEPANQYLILDVNANLGNLQEKYIPRFLVMPMAAQANSITFRLDDTNKYYDGSDKETKRSAYNVVFDHTSSNYGVGNTLALPWMMRRQYCDYKFYLVGAYDKNDATNKLSAQIEAKRIDDLILDDETPQASNAHRLSTAERSSSNSFWTTNVVDLTSNTSVYNSTQHEYVVPEEWKDKDVFILVKYKPTAEFEAMKSTSAAGAKWINIKNVENGNMMRYTRSGNVTGESRDSLNDVTNDYLWAVEGDPYGFVLHNRYAVHGFDGTLNKNWSTLLTTDKVNSTENFNYRSGVDDANENFTYDDNGDPVIKSAILYGAKGTSNAFGTVSETTTNAVYEAMTGNYDKGMIIHPVNGCINIKDQNGYKYFGAFMFNGAPTGDPVQLNYMQDWEVMRNVYANWTLNKPTAAQLLPYYNRAGFVGGLKADVAANTELSYGGGTVDVPALFSALSAGTATAEQFNTAWDLVHDPANLVPFESGKFYRLKAYSAGNGVVGGDYVSGYLHKTELDGAKPLHIYGKAGVASNISSLLSYDGNEWAAEVANKSLLEIPDVESDPSSIFYVTRDENGYVKMETQGLVVSDSKMMAVPAEPTTAQTESMLFQMQDIGLGAFQMRTKANVTGENAETSYLSCNPNTLKYGLNTEAKELNIASGVSSGATVKTHDTKWLLEPVGTTAANSAGNTYQRPLNLKLKDYGEDMYYASVCLPFDVTIPTGAYAYSCTNTMRGEEKTAPNGSKYYQVNITKVAGEGLANGNRVLPAGVPAIIYVDGWDLAGKEVTDASTVPLTVADPSEIKWDANTVERLRDSQLKYQYLTQELEDVTDDQWVFVFGKSGRNVGFMRNANSDYTGMENNKFVVHNKLYYTQPKTAGQGGRFLFLNFSAIMDEVQDPPIATGVQEVTTSERMPMNEDNTIYDLQGRKVTQVVSPGVYIVNGKKVVIKK